MSTCAIAPVFVHASVKRRKNVWYSQKDGNWTDPTVWESNAIKRYNYPGQNIAIPIFPQVGDDVYVNHQITLNTGSVAAPLIINNLYVSGTFKADNSTRVIQVNGDLQAVGGVDFTSSNVNIILKNVNGYIVSFTSGTTSNFTYGCFFYSQPIMNLSYRNLTTILSGIKYLTSNLTVTGNVAINTGSFLDFAAFNCTVNGTTIVDSNTGVTGSTLQKTGSGSILFIGILTIGANMDFSGGNPSIECRGGAGSGSGSSTLPGTGIWTFTTNNQNLSFRSAIFSSILVSGAITVTVSFTIQINTSIDGDNASSKIVNTGTIRFNTTTAPMATLGIFDISSFANTVEYMMNAIFTIAYNNYSSLTISGTGVKTGASGATTIAATFTISGAAFTLGGNTTVSGNTVLGGGSPVLDLSTFDMTFTGTSTFGSGGTLRKTSSGNILFIGGIGGGAFTFDLTGNPAIELRGGAAPLPGTVNGTSVWTFTTNNQSLALSNITPSISGNFLISGAITVTLTVTTGNLTMNGTIDGNNAASTFDNRGVVQYKNATRPMATNGVLQCNGAANTFKYNKAGAQDVTGGTYRTIEFGGSGVKTLQGNVIINVTAGGSQSTTGTASVNLNGFTITTI